MSNFSDITNRYSIASGYSKYESSCGYCSSDYGSFSYGNISHDPLSYLLSWCRNTRNNLSCTDWLQTYSLRVEDYQNMIDRGWRRCGKYCYKSIMDKSCCPLYTIRCAAQEFKLSKTQKKILKRFNNFLINGTVSTSKIHKSTEIVQPLDTNFVNKECENISESMEPPFVDISAPVGCNNQEEIKVESLQFKPSEQKPQNAQNSAEKGAKNKCMKAKQLRIQRKRQKLQNLGLSEEEICKKLVEKKKYPVVKTIEDYVKELDGKTTVHNLSICLVRSYPRSETFNSTFEVAFDLYKRYQQFIHKNNPEKLTENQFKGFLVHSPLQIVLVQVNSFEFTQSLNESALLFAKYQKTIHQESDSDCDIVTFHNVLIESPFKAVNGYGSYHQQYWLDGKLIAVGVIDILPRCLSSVYFFYDPDYAHLSLGTYGALREVEFTRKLSSAFPDLIYYYMGFYIHSCVKMKYKGAFKPSYLLCPEVYSWHPIERCLPKIEASKYSRLNEDTEARDQNSDINPHEVYIYSNMTMSLSSYLRKRNVEPRKREEILECAKLIGKTCAKTMLLVQM